MNYITSTQLRTKIPELIKALEKGQSVPLLHRSQIIGVFNPIKEDTNTPPATLEKLLAFQKQAKPEKLIPREKREEIYRKRLIEEYKQSA